jgi:hypothetical protein
MLHFLRIYVAYVPTFHLSGLLCGILCRIGPERPKELAN